MTRLSRRRVLTLAMAVADGCAGRGAHAEPSIERRPWPAHRVTPPLDLEGYEGPGFRLARTRGKVVLLNFWATWCEPCRSEMPSLELLAALCANDGLVVVAVNKGETDAAIHRFMETMPISLPIARDGDGAAARAYGVHIFPTTVAVGRDGRAAFSVVGAVEWNAEPARGWVLELLNARQP